MEWGEMAVRLGLALVCGGLLGWERESEGKPAGVRTHMLVCLGSCLFLLVAARTATTPNNEAAARVISGVVQGIGFLGAGTIMRDGGAVFGLTSAASIWVTSAIGIALGAGAFDVALVATGLASLILRSMLPGLKHRPGMRRLQNDQMD